MLSVGRLVEKKGFEFALRALRRALADNASLHYHLIGDGPLRASLEALVTQLEIGGHVTFHGQLAREQVEAVRRRAQLVLVPSVTAADGDEEGIPVVVMEAMAAGLAGDRDAPRRHPRAGRSTEKRACSSPSGTARRWPPRSGACSAIPRSTHGSRAGHEPESSFNTIWDARTTGWRGCSSASCVRRPACRKASESGMPRAWARRRVDSPASLT